MSAQTTIDSIPAAKIDSVVTNPVIQAVDSTVIYPVNYAISKRPLKDTGWSLMPTDGYSISSTQQQIMAHHPYFGFSAVITPYIIEEVKVTNGKELLFYSLVFLLIVFALLKLAFPKYFTDLFRLFFRTTLNQRQVSEQLIQTPLPSIMLNIFFVISTGFYISLLLEIYKTNPVDNFWLLFGYCVAGLSAAYFVKFIGLKLSGWLFNTEEPSNAYVFLVFIMNKILGIMLLPFLFILAFSTGNLLEIGLTLSFCCIGALLVYRIILSYGVVRNQVKVSLFHFFLYFLAFEIAPLLLVYKALLLFFVQNS